VPGGNLSPYIRRLWPSRHPIELGAIKLSIARSILPLDVLLIALGRTSMEPEQKTRPAGPAIPLRRKISTGPSPKPCRSRNLQRCSLVKASSQEKWESREPRRTEGRQKSRETRRKLVAQTWHTSNVQHCGSQRSLRRLFLRHAATLYPLRMYGKPNGVAGGRAPSSVAGQPLTAWVSRFRLKSQLLAQDSFEVG
jgi:hypothetical protein